MTASAALAAALVGSSGLVVVLALGIALRRGARRWRTARQRRRTLPVRPLLMELVAGDAEDQQAAWQQLTRLDAGTWRAVEASVVDLLGKVRGEGRRAVTQLLTERGVLHRAHHDLHRRGAVRRARAAELLGAAGDAAAVEALVELLTHRDADLRAVAARALGRLGSPAATAPLLATLQEPVRVPVPVVAHALLRIGLPGAAAVQVGLDSPVALVRATAAEVVGRVGAVTATDRLRDLLRHDPLVEVRCCAATALGRLGVPTSLAALVAASAAAAPAAVRLAATRAMGELGVPAAAGRLGELLADTDERVATEAGAALVALGEDGRRELQRVAAAGRGGPATAPAREALALAAVGGQATS